MNAFVVGAGLSKTADYPVTSELLDELKEFGKRHGGTSFVDFSWTQWRSFLDWVTKRRPNFLVAESGRQRNLEYLLTTIDLYLSLKQDLENALWSGIRIKSGTTKKWSMLADVVRYRDVLYALLAHYFEWKHLEEADFKNRDRRRWVQRFCDSQLHDGDVVITFNYDSLLERCLTETRRWHPYDGLGLELQLIDCFGQPYAHDGKSSRIKILKLHGSVGWATPRDGSRVLLKSGFLSAMGFDLHDKHPYSGFNELCLIGPSFVKRMNIPVLRELWWQAATALSQAQRIAIVGYSLPPADGAITALLLATCASKRVTFVNKSAEAVNRFRILFPAMTARPMSIQDWLCR